MAITPDPSHELRAAEAQTEENVQKMRQSEREGFIPKTA
jgi:hypothetical protein